MSPEEFVAQMNQRLQQLNEVQLIFSAAEETHAMQVERIFGRGEKASGNIGTYSAKPMYAGRKQFNGGGFPGIGKTGRTNFNSGKPHQSVFLIEGYRQLKQMQGYESSFVNLTYSSELKQDFSGSLTIQDGYVTSGISNTADIKKWKA